MSVRRPRILAALLGAVCVLLLLAVPANAHGPVTADGAATEWMTGFGSGGCPALPAANAGNTFNTSAGCVTSNGAGAEFIWTDATGDQRTDHWNGTGNLDLTQFRVTLDSANAYFLMRFSDITDCNAQYLQIAINSSAVTTSNSTLPDSMETTTSSGQNWFRVIEANTTSTGYWTDGSTFTAGGTSFCSTTNNLWEIAMPRSALGMIDLSPTFFFTVAVACNNSGAPCESSGSDVMDAITTTGPNTFNEVGDGGLDFIFNPTPRTLTCASISFPYTLPNNAPATLIDAIQCANANGAGTDTINLNGLTVSLTDSFADYTGATGLPQITTSVILRNGTITRSSANLFRLLSASNSATLRLEDLTLTNGGGAGYASEGAGLRSTGSLFLTGVTMSGHLTSSSGGAIAIPSLQSGAEIQVINSTLSGNTATVGGAVHFVPINGGSFLIDSSTLANNVGTGGPGAVSVNGLNAVMSITNSTFSANSANSTSPDAIGVFSNAEAFILFSTFSGHDNGTAASTVGIIHAATNASIDMVASVIANNLRTGGGTARECTFSGASFTGEDNYTADSSCPSRIAAPQFISTTLANNGGPTQTHLPAPHSNVVNADTGNSCDELNYDVPFDQRGEPRPTGPECDMGAVEIDACGSITFPYTLPDNAPATLNAAIDCANSTISTSDVINLNGQTVTLTDSYGDFTGATGLEAIRSPITLRNGTITRSGSNQFRLLNVSINGNLTLRDMTLTNGGGTTYGDGGGLISASSGSTLTIVRSTLSGAVGSTGSSGGAIFASGTVNIINSTVSGNQGGRGGAIAAQNGPVNILNSVISGNVATSAANGGGAMFLVSITTNDVRIVNSTITGNYATGTGATRAGAILGDATSGVDVFIINSVVWGNSNNGGAAPQIVNSAINATNTATTSIIQGGQFSALNSDPLFVTPLTASGTPSTAGDFTLQNNSPAIDAGANADVPADTFDVDGDSNTSENAPDRAYATRRVNDTGVTDTGTGTAPIVDLGAFEKQTNSPTGPCVAITFPYTLPDNTPATLITAIECANANGASADTINLNGQTVTLTASYGNYSGATGLPQITTNITLRNGTLTRTGSNEFRFLNVSNTGTLTVRDMTLTNGGGATYAANGGSILSQGTASTLTVVNSTLSGSRVDGVQNGSAIYSNAIFTITNSRVVGNGLGRGAIASINGPALIQNTLVAGNSAFDTTNGGGGVYFGNILSATIVNSTITGNYVGTTLSTQPGGVLAAGGTINLTIRNSIIWGNSNNGNTAPQVVNSTSGTNTVTNSIIQGGQFGALNSNPLFVTPITASGTPSTSGNFALQDNSPAIDAGANADVPADTFDVDGDSNTSEDAPDRAGNSRRYDDTGVTDTGTGTAPIVDIGAFEKQTNSPVNPCAAITFPYTLPNNTPATLITAIECANANGAGADTINLNGQTVTLTASHANYVGATGLPQITTEILIRNGTITRSGSNQFRLLYVSATGILRLHDMTLSNGGGATYASDGGILTSETDSSVTIWRSNITGGSVSNSSSAGGLFTSGTFVMANSRVQGNIAGRGGGILSQNGPVTITNSVISGNVATNPIGGGGAMYLPSAGVTIINSTITGNYASASGAAYAGGILSDISGANLTLRNTIVWGNPNSDGSAPQIVNDSAFGSNIVTNSIIQGGQFGALNSNPLFVTPITASATPSTAGNFALQDTSPAVDAGANANVPADTFDADGDTNTSEDAPDLAANPRRYNDTGVADTGSGTAPIVDLGAFEKQTNSPFNPCAAITFPYTLPDNTPATLITAIECANANGAGADTINLNGQTVTLTASYANYTGATGLPQITTDITLRNGTITRSGSNQFRLLAVSSVGSLRLDNIIATNGFGPAPGSVGGGGAIYNAAGTINIVNSRFSGNASDLDGGAIHNDAGTLYARDTIFSGNQTNVPGGGVGGAMANTNGIISLYNVLISGNRAVQGGGIYNNNNSSLTLVNVTIAGNLTNDQGGGLRNENTAASVVITNTLISGNQSTVFPANSNLGGDVTSTFSLIGGSPLFVAPELPSAAPTTNGNYRLGDSSPAVDAGDNSAMVLTTDLAGNPRRYDDTGVADTGSGTAPIVDIGAYEKQTNTPPPSADLSITKTDGQTSDTAGTSITYTIVASNAGPGNASTATVADTFPANITGVTWTCVGAGGGTCTASGSGNLNQTVNLPVGGSVTFTATGTISAAATGTLSNTATVSSALTDPTPGNNSATDTTTLTQSADMSITKTDGQTSDISGTSISYTIVASNLGPSDVASATVADTFPVGINSVTWTCVGAGGATCTASGSANINQTVSLPAGGSVTFTVNAAISSAATGTLSNTATVSSAITDPTPGNNSATDTTNLTQSADLSITKTDGQTSDTAGTSITYTIVAGNIGASNAPSVTVVDTFPASITGVTWTCVALGGTCPASGTGDINTSISLISGGSATFTVTGTISPSATGTLSNTATISSALPDPNPSNNSATDTTTLTQSADLSITKTDGQTSDTAGTSITYTIVASNAGPSDAATSAVLDTFPASITGVTWTCVGAGGGVCNPSGSGNLNETVNLPVGGSVTFTATGTINPAATGTLSNTATVNSIVSDPTPGNNSATDTTSVVSIPSISINDVTLSEGDSGVTPFSFTISLGSSSLSDVTFDIATADNTATVANGDYVSNSQTGVIIPAGQTTATFMVLVNRDTVVEPNETFFVNLTNVTGATVGDGQGQGTIVNDDVDPCAAITFPYTLPNNAPATLITAIECANANGTADIIDLNGQTVTLTASYASYTGATGLPQITTNVTLENGVITRDSGAPQFRLLNVGATGSLTIDGLIVSGGSLSSSDNAGAIYNDGGTLTVLNSIVTNNSAGFGGAFYNVGSTATMMLVDSQFTSNSATENSGFLMNDGGSATILRSTVSGNSSSGPSGNGAIYNFQADLDIIDSTFSGNTSTTSVGAVQNFAGTTNIANSVFAGNSTLNTSGAVLNNAGGVMTITNSTFTGNRAGNIGGALTNNTFSTLTITNSTFAGNNSTAGGGGIHIPGASTTTITNSIVWGNNGNTLTGATITHSIIEGGFAGTGNLNVDPLFVSPLAFTSAPNSLGNYHLQDNSPAIDAGSNAAVPVDTFDVNDNASTTDEAPDLAGNPRRYDDTGVTDTGSGTAPIVDIGAYEKQTNTPVDPCAAITFPYTLPNNAPATLITAIECANANGAGADTIDLNGQTVTLTAIYTSAYGSGTGLPEITTAVVIQNGTITRSSADLFRFFIYSGSSSLTLNNITLSNGNADWDGGAIWGMGSSTLIINNSRIIGNYGNYGGAIFVPTSGTAVITNTLISGNRASSPGGGIRNRGTLTLNNSTIAANFTTAGTEGGGGIANNGGTVVLNNSIVSGNEASSFPATNDIRGAYTANNSLVAFNPLFVAPLDASDTAPTVNGDYRLANGSPVIDAGNNSLIPGGVTTDLDGNPRRYDDTGITDTGTGTAPIVDLGAYEKQTNTPPPSADLSITKTDGQTTDTAGTTITYTIVASNAGPSNVASATVADTFPASITGVTWTCVGAGGATCTASGSGNLNQTVNLPAGGSVTFTATGTINPAATGTLSNTATVSSAVSDPNPANNSATDTTSVQTAGVTISPTTVNLTEAGTTGTYTVVLTAAPTDDVTIEMSYGGQVEVSTDGVTFSPSPVSVTFTTANWNTPRTITVRAVNDRVVEGAHNTSVDHETTSSDINYTELSIDSVTAEITDNDTASYQFGSTNTIVSEGIGTTLVTVTLAFSTNGIGSVSSLAEPLTVPIIIGGGSTATGGGVDYSVVATSVTFPIAGNSQNISTTVVDDAIDEGTETVIRNLGTATSASTAMLAQVSAGSFTQHTLTITDNDTAGVVITEASGTANDNAITVTEGGANSSFAVVLTSQPTSDVSVSLTFNGSIIQVGSPVLGSAPFSLTFTAANWNTPQIVNVGAVNDNTVVNHGSTNLSLTVGSADSNYTALPTQPVSPIVVTVIEDDIAGVVITETSGTANDNAITVTEGGANSSFAVVLTSQPTSDVSVSLTFNGSIIQAGSPVLGSAPFSLIFNTANWNIPQTVNVGAVNDNAVVNHGSTNLSLTVGSTDSNYTALPTQPVSPIVVTVIEDDIAGVTVSPTAVNVTEGGATGSYSVVLTSQPTGDVTISIGNGAQTSTSPTSLTFTTGNWNTAQSVTVTAVDDAVVEGAHNGTITHTAAGGGYGAVSVASVTANITDNDAAGVSVTPTTVNVTEGGATGTYSVVLTSQPTGDVTISIGNGAQTSTTPTSLTFTTGNWNTAQTVTVTAVDDAVVEGAHSGTITHTASSTDTAYNGITVASVTANITDNDAAGVSVTPTTVNVTEGGATGTYSVVLTSQPTSDVTISIGNGAQTSTVPTSLTFTTGNWNTAQTVTVTAVDDAVVEGAHNGTITHTASSTDTAYNGITVASVTANITDNDSAIPTNLLLNPSFELPGATAQVPLHWVGSSLTVNDRRMCNAPAEGACLYRFRFIGIINVDRMLGQTIQNPTWATPGTTINLSAQMATIDQTNGAFIRLRIIYTDGTRSNAAILIPQGTTTSYVTRSTSLVVQNKPVAQVVVNVNMLKTTGTTRLDDLRLTATPPVGPAASLALPEAPDGALPLPLPPSQ